jgi:formamidopyrimidine-DNA glycosylase
MPELPDVTIYVEALRERILGHKLENITIRGPFLLRSVSPAPESLYGKTVADVRRIGKQIAIGVEGDLWLVLHLMIAGRLHWRVAGAKPPGKNALAVFTFDSGALFLTEAGTQHRAAIRFVAGEPALRDLHAGGIEVLDSDLAAFSSVLTAENHTLKRALTGPRWFSGIGNAYSDEILHHARLSPVALTQKLKPEEIERLYYAVRQVLKEWVDRLRSDAKGKFPERVTAFREEMAVHGRYGLPCPRCGGRVARIRYAANETNYCPNCQTGGKLLADRALSRLLHEDWPRTPEELEALKKR